MDREVFINQLNILLGDYLKSLGFILVDIIYRHEGRDLVLRILVDRSQGHACLPARQGLATFGQNHRPEGGINMAECAMLNRNLSGFLDEKDIIKERYVLEVSSPGLDRPLKAREDFLRSLKKKTKFFLKEHVNGKLEWDGIIDNVDEESVSITVSEGIIQLPLTKINKAKLIF